jgi:hypothetical protein
MAATRSRPPWFGNVGVQVLAGLALVYNVVQMVRWLLDANWSAAFLSFAWCVLFGYVISESLRTRREQQQAAAESDAPPEPID